MSKFDRAFKQPYELVSTRYSQTRGDISIYRDRNREVYIVGINLTLENIKEGGEYGVREFITRDDAYNYAMSLADD